MTDGERELKYKKEGIAGWLLVFTVVLGLTILYNTYSFICDCLAWLPRASSLTEALVIQLFLIDTVLLAVVALQVLAFIFLLKKKIVFRVLVICAVGLMLLLNVAFLALFYGRVTPNPLFLFGGDLWWILYLFQSERVTAVFARPGEPGHSSPARRYVSIKKPAADGAGFKLFQVELPERAEPRLFF